MLVQVKCRAIRLTDYRYLYRYWRRLKGRAIKLTDYRYFYRYRHRFKGRAINLYINWYSLPVGYVTDYRYF